MQNYNQKYKEEAKQRWSHTEAYKESVSKTAKYSKADWNIIND